LEGYDCDLPWQVIAVVWLIAVCGYTLAFVLEFRWQRKLSIQGLHLIITIHVEIIESGKGLVDQPCLRKAWLPVDMNGRSLKFKQQVA
jgi:hypothetical protein